MRDFATPQGWNDTDKDLSGMSNVGITTNGTTLITGLEEMFKNSTVSFMTAQPFR